MYQKLAMLAAVLLLLTACQAKPKPAEPSLVPPGPEETVSQEKPEENPPPLDTETPETPETQPMEPLQPAETVSAEEPKPEEEKQPPAAEKPEPPKAEQPATGTEEQPPAAETPKEPEQTPTSLPTPSTQQEITDILREAILQKQETVQLDVSQMTWMFGADLDLRNAYYDVLNQWPELKYAYDVQFSQTGQKVDYTIFYMPYQTDAYAQGIPEGAVEIRTLKISLRPRTPCWTALRPRPSPLPMPTCRWTICNGRCCTVDTDFLSVPSMETGRKFGSLPALRKRWRTARRHWKPRVSWRRIWWRSW